MAGPLRHKSCEILSLVVAFMAFAHICGCDDTYNATWQFTFESEELQEQTSVIEAQILAGGCGSENVVYQALLTPLVSGSPPSALGEGTYGFYGRAGSADCDWIADGCFEHTLPLEEGSVIEIRLRASEPEPYCESGYCVLGRCNDIDGGPDGDADVDGDGDADADMDSDIEEDADQPETPPATPRLLAPLNGWATGSVHAPPESVRRPGFRWAPAARAVQYELEVDDSCTTPGFATCAFESPELSRTVTTTRFTPDAPLAVGTTVPVGRRYYWRVRACNDSGCSDWSAHRYVDVARLFNDVNGDGFSDLVISAVDFEASLATQGAVFPFHGSASGPSATGARILSPTPVVDGQFGFSLAMAGDVNADGFSDVVVGSRGNDLVVILNGSSSGLDVASAVVLTGDAGSDFGQRVSSAGDMNADGFADIVVGAHRANNPAGRAFVFFGSSTGIADDSRFTLENPNASGGRFGSFVAGVGDTNGDGFADVIIGAYLNPPGGQVFVYQGSESGASSSPAQTIGSPPPAAGGRFGIVVSAAGDTNGDGYSDIIVGDYLRTGTYPEEGAAFVFEGSSAGLDASPVTTLTSPHAEEAGHFGWRIASAGDFDRDGFADVLVGATNEDSDAENSGRAYLFRGSATGTTDAPSRIFNNPNEGQADAGFGLSLANCGDLNGDGYSNLMVGAPLQNVARGRAFIYASDASGLPTAPTREIDSPEDQTSASFSFALETGLAP